MREMHVTGLDHLLALAGGTAFDGKMVINELGAVFGPVSVQHRDLRAPGVTYADNYKGNAVAAMLAPNKIELRFHQAFTDEHIAGLIRALAAEPGLAFLASWDVTYQGRRVHL